MILLTGAAGKTGRAILEKLARVSLPVRAFAHRVEQLPLLLELGATEAIAGDLLSDVDLIKATIGIDSVYFICSNVNPNELEFGKKIITAATEAGVKHFVYHSVLHPQIEAMPHHWQKMRVEEALLKAKLPFTILQPAPYMQNLLSYWQRITNEGIYSSPIAPNAMLSYVSLEDVADAAKIVLAEPIYHNLVLEIVGTAGMTQTEVCDQISLFLGKTVEYRLTPRGTWIENNKNKMTDYELSALTKMFDYYNTFGLEGSPQTLTWLLGRKPLTYEQFLERIR